MRRQNQYLTFLAKEKKVPHLPDDGTILQHFEECVEAVDALAPCEGKMWINFTIS
jgi:hypothetical protein